MTDLVSVADSTAGRGASAGDGAPSVDLTRPPRSVESRKRVATVAAGAALAAVAFGAAGGAELTRTTVVEILVVLAAAALVAFGVIRARAGRLDGGLTLAAFAALAALTALSIIWSIVPELSWIEANRTFAYLAAFALTIFCGRLFPNDYAVLLRGLLIAAFAAVAPSAFQ